MRFSLLDQVCHAWHGAIPHDPRMAALSPYITSVSQARKLEKNEGQEDKASGVYPLLKELSINSREWLPLTAHWKGGRLNILTENIVSPK